MVILAPIASLLAVAATTPAQAATTDPVAAGVKGITQNLPVASTLNEVVTLPAYAESALFSVAKGTATARKTTGGSQDAISHLGKGVVKGVGLDMVFSGLEAKCATVPGEAVTGLTKIVDGKLVGNGLAGAPALPATPPVGYRVPLNDPNLVVTLNKQVRDPLGGLTVTAMTIDSANSKLPREVGVSHCGPAQVQAPAEAPAAPAVKAPEAAKPAPAEAPAQRAKTGHDPLHNALGLPQQLLGSVTGGLTGGPLDTVNSLTGQVTGVTGSLPGQVNGATGSLPVPLKGSAPSRLDNLTGGLSGIFGGLPGLTGALPLNALPALTPNDV